MRTGYFISLGLKEGALRYFVPLPMRQWCSGLPPSEPLRSETSFSPEVAAALVKGFLFAASALRLPPDSRPTSSDILAPGVAPRLKALARMSTNLLAAAHALAEGLSKESLAQAAMELRLLSPSLPRLGPVWMGTSHSLYQSSWVCPAPDVFRELADDLCQFFNDDARGDVLTLAAVHLQFTSLHPLRDGNGRMARALVFAMVLRYTGSATLGAAVTWLLVQRGGRLAQCQRRAREGELDALYQFWSGLLKAAKHLAQLSRAYILALVGRGGFELPDILPALERFAWSGGEFEAEPHPLLYRRHVTGVDRDLYESRPYSDLFGALGAGRRLKAITPWFESSASFGAVSFNGLLQADCLRMRSEIA